ncbi:MAG: [NiFe]-hydrogenase assembly chaperone HybE [Gammaproteobacteria bacterium]|nr:[NiFe]-hydrogenase assembly chaperone HybE [Gammaproteobacteria bacterium]
MTAAAELGFGFERLYRRIERERMAGIPLLNSALCVRAVGFRGWQNSVLGVLVTPWFMNLMLLPGEHEDWRELHPGSKVLHRFPSGEYEFIVGEEADVGRFQSCSLFSPMFEFKDQRSAELTAAAVMAGIMVCGKRHERSASDAGYQGRDDVEHAGGGLAFPPGAEDRLPRRMERPVSRRELLRAMLPSDADQ